MRDNMDGYGGGGDAVRQQKICGMTDMAKMGWKDGNKIGKYQQVTATNLRAYRCSDKLGVGATANLNDTLGCIWRLCVSYCNLNKTTC